MSSEIKVPDLGSDDAVEVIEVLVEAGQTVSKDDPLITIESDKATFEVPAETSGTIAELTVSVGDQVSTGDVIGTLDEGETGDKPTNKPEASESKQQQDQSVSVEQDKSEVAPSVASSSATSPEPSRAASQPTKQSSEGVENASPKVRKVARELGVNLSQVEPSGADGRITLDDIQLFVREQFNALDQAAAPKAEDPSRYGEVERTELTKIRAMTAAAVHRSWLEAPMVTHFDEADITELEDYRKRNRLGFLPFLLKAVANTLEEFPLMRSSIDVKSAELVQKNYYRIGLAVNTEQGLLRPVLSDVEQQNIAELGQSLKKLVNNARAGKLSPADQRGAVFTVSSLGAAGGTQFTPIVNSPEVGILGVSKTQIKPIYADGEFVPATMLPLALSYDHRVIDGVYAAEFIRVLIDRLEGMAGLLE